MRFLFFTLIFLSASVIFSQRITSFSVTNVKGVVAVRFSISPGTTVNSYSILRSTDSLNYYSIYDYSTTCGYPDRYDDRMYDDHSPVLNQANFYKVQLFPYEQSQPLRVFVTASSSLYVYPNPVGPGMDLLHMKFTQIKDKRVFGGLYNQSGNPVRVLDFTTVGDAFTLNISDLNNGLYLLWLTDGSQAFSCKFILNH
jgi:hypothetical protein